MLLEASPQLNSLPQQWLNHLLTHLRRPGQSRDDMVRRRAGLPAAWVALFAGEPTGNPKTLLHTGEAGLLSWQNTGLSWLGFEFAHYHNCFCCSLCWRAQQQPQGSSSHWSRCCSYANDNVLHNLTQMLAFCGSSLVTNIRLLPSLRRAHRQAQDSSSRVKGCCLHAKKRLVQCLLATL